MRAPTRPRPAQEPEAQGLAQAGGPPSKSRWSSVLRAGYDWTPPVLAFAGVIALWQGAISVFEVPTWLLPAPSDIAAVLVEQRSSLLNHTRVTLSEASLGYAAAIVTGIPLAVAIVYSKFLERTVYPFLVAMQSVPKIAIAPLLVLWLGFGVYPKIAMVVLLCIFPVVISTATGLKSTPPEFLELSRSLCASEYQIFRKVRFPAAMPHIFVALKLAVSLAVIGAVVGEFVAADQGLGFLVILAGAHSNAALAFAAIILLALIAIIFFYVVVGLERLTVGWAGDSESG